jgi:hypothetical protein
MTKRDKGAMFSVGCCGCLETLEVVRGGLDRGCDLGLGDLRTVMFCCHDRTEG